jgi:RAMP superfamily
MAIKAPFRFARINRKVYFPEWGHLVSHDVPFADGYCGEIPFTITTKTPLIVGGKRGDGRVEPFKGPDERPAIPGSSLQGMIRSILEVATFAKLGPNVKEQRFGVRDISDSATGRQLYQARMTARPAGVITSHSKAGWLRKVGMGGVEIVDCHLARIEIDKVADAAQSKRGLTPAQRNQVCSHLHREGQHNATAPWKDADGRYVEFLGGAALADLDIDIEFLDTDGILVIGRDDRARGRLHSRNNTISYIKCQPASGRFAAELGTLVLSGKSSASNNPGFDHTKHMEFVFYGPARSQVSAYSNSVPVSDSVWKEFLFIHDPEKGTGKKINPNWAFWKPYFEKGEPVPVFYLKEVRDGAAQITAIGTAQMFKLAMSLSTHDLLNNSAPDHTAVFDGKLDGDTGKLDLPSLIFGAIGGSKEDYFRHSLKRRAAFDMASLPIGTNVAPKTDNPAVALLSPKPNYYPIYVRQSPNHGNGRPYAAYHPMGDTSPETKCPELSGVKVWPASGRNRLQQAAAAQTAAKVPTSVRTTLDTIPEETKFEGKVRIHNLREVELGALLWALTFGQPEAFDKGGVLLRHRIGGGKPYGLGEVEIRVTDLGSVHRNDNGAAADGLALVNTFKVHMEETLGRHWEDSPQVQALLKAAHVAEDGGDDALDYMQLDKPTVEGNNGRQKPGPFSYIGARDAGLIMSGYADNVVTELPKPPCVENNPQHGHGHPDQHLAVGRPQQAQPRQRQNPVNLPRVEDAPVRHADGREGYIRRILHGYCEVSVDGNLENWQFGAFTVTGKPDDE